MTVRFTDEETEALRIAAEAEGVSMNNYARTAVRELIARRGYAARVADSAARGAERYAEALHRLGTV